LEHEWGLGETGPSWICREGFWCRAMAELSKEAMAIAWHYLGPHAWANHDGLAAAIDAHAAEMVAEERRRCQAWITSTFCEEDGAIEETIFGVESGDWPKGVNRG
jgi:hypothetical protein